MASTQDHLQILQPQKQDAKKLLTDWIVFSCTFSLLHATIVNEIGLGSSFFGIKLSQDNNALLYGFYGLSALFLGPGAIAYLGPKKALMAGYLLYDIYDIAFLIGSYLETDSTAQWVVILLGGSIGGIGAGLLWMGQGVFFGACAKRYAEAKEIEQTKASSYLAGIFAAFLLGGELFLNIVTYIVFEATEKNDNSKRVVEWVFTVCAIVSTIIYIFVVKDVEKPQESGQRSICSADRATQGARIACTDPITNLLGLLPAAFSFMAAFVNGAYNAQIISDNIGVKYIPLFSMIKPGVATIVNLIYVKLQMKMLFTFLGCGSFIAAALMMWIFPTEQLQNAVFIVIILSLFSIGRSAYEGPMKATYVDLFAGPKQPAAFSNLVMWNAFPSMLAFFFFNNPTFYSINWTWTSIICLGTSCAALVAYFFVQKWGISYYDKKKREEIQSKETN